MKEAYCHSLLYKKESIDNAQICPSVFETKAAARAKGSVLGGGKEGRGVDKGFGTWADEQLRPGVTTTMPPRPLPSKKMGGEREMLAIAQTKMQM